MEYQYYNQFHLDDNLKNAISQIVSKKEGKEYVCKTVGFIVGSHRDLVFTSDLDILVPYGGGLNALSGAERAAIEEKYGKHVYETIPEKTCSYIILIEKELYNRLIKISRFKSQDEIEGILSFTADVVIRYIGFFEPYRAMNFTYKFPYLKSFFNELDEWRASEGRTTIDDKILNACVEHAINEDTPKKLHM